ncbi:hypothetical protein [Streptomyces cucumeris]|uniref:hypothetical protein n=1 Tax=Streptomyces cucumeris TaxID=2962890 RepID=UPI0020C8EDFB|nr:hypothetical protein [Streptomyces sp. NEAU-Y11]MCP9209539.1 hypothetical protein [Streptomyces sp. NEAU-Y11]
MPLNADHAYRWQAAAHRILGELITEGRDNGLPPLTWTLATTGALTGEVHGLGTTIKEQRATLTAWAAHLGATIAETPRTDGRTSLHALISRDGERIGILRAELFPELNNDPEDHGDSDGDDGSRNA